MMIYGSLHSSRDHLKLPTFTCFFGVIVCCILFCVLFAVLFDEDGRDLMSGDYAREQTALHDVGSKIQNCWQHLWQVKHLVMYLKL